MRSGRHLAAFVAAMDRTTIFPAILIALDLGASVVYAVTLDWRRSLYWLAAAVLTACVTF
jgi:hypothetical protein